MGQSRTLARKISQQGVAIAQRNAAKRAHKYWHASERLRQMARISRAKVMVPNRAS